MKTIEIPTAMAILGPSNLFLTELLVLVVQLALGRETHKTKPKQNKTKQTKPKQNKTKQLCLINFPKFSWLPRSPKPRR
jgi:hypothetical protein